MPINSYVTVTETVTVLIFQADKYYITITVTVFHSPGIRIETFAARMVIETCESRVLIETHLES